MTIIGYSLCRENAVPLHSEINKIIITTTNQDASQGESQKKKGKNI